jgi:hypothetical protein
MARKRVVLNEALWVLGEVICKFNRGPRSEAAALQERGANIFFLKGGSPPENLAELAELLRKSDRHVILSWLLPRELKALQPLLRERKNFSLSADDWWIQPHWFMREAEYIFFRKYQGIAVRTGKTTFCPGFQPPWILNPYPEIGWYTNLATALRLPALALSPAVNACNWFRRKSEVIDPAKYIFFPFPISAGDVQMLSQPIHYDFANTGSSCGIWIMRDPHVSFHYTFGNLYYDRELLTDAIAKFAGNPYRFYDCRHGKRLPYDEYARKNQQSKYLVITGGLQGTSVPKYLEYVCAGTPMIGTPLAFEHPWLDECLFPLEISDLQPGRLKPKLDEALARYPVIRENCLNWRERILKNYAIHQLLDVVQTQLDGKPVPPGYLRPGV